MSKLQLLPKPISLRPRKAKDEAFLREAYESSRDEELKNVLWENRQQKDFFFRQQFDAQQLNFDNFYEKLDYDIIEYHGKPIGRLILEWKDNHLHCVDIIIMTKYRKQKIGTAIMDAIVKEIDRREISASLMFEKWKPYLEKFYEGYGFKRTKEYPMHYYMEREGKSHD